MSENTMTPLWLDIKKEYIDENFEGVLKYLHRMVKNPDLQDSFYQTTVNLLEERMQALIESVTAAPLQENMCKDADLKLYCRMCGLYILTFPDDSELRRNAYSLMLQCLLLLSQQHIEELAELSVANLLGRMSERRPFSWEDIIEFKEQVLAHKIVKSTVLTDGLDEEFRFAGKGSVTMKKGVMELSCLSPDDSARAGHISAVELLDGQLHIMSEKDARLKKSELDNLQAMSDFTDGFIHDLKECTVRQNTYKKHYEDGDTAEVVIVSKGQRIKVRTISKEHETIEGYIKTPELSNINYYIEDFNKYLLEGDILRLEIVNADKGIFSLDEEFKDYIINDRSDDSVAICAYINRIIPDRKGKEKVYMWCDQGYAVQAFGKGEYKEGQFVMVKILSYGEHSFYGTVLTEILCESDEDFDVDEAKSDCVAGFALPAEEEKEEIGTLSAETIKMLCRTLSVYQKHLLKPSERYRILCAIRILAEMTKNTEDAKYARFLSEYMENLVSFARSEYDKIRLMEYDSEDEPESVARRKRVVQILKAYGDDSMNEMLDQIVNTDTDELIKKIAILVLSCNRIDHVISKSMQNVIKREVIKCLAIETEIEADLDEENGTYLGIENDRQEFKTSFFIAPKNAREQNQKLTILRGMCAFLNTRVGGTLYLGVDDLGYIKGVSQDIEYMERTTYGRYKGLDGYMRCITDEAKKIFDISVLTNIRIAPMYDNQVIAITVNPYEYDIVKVDDQAWIRINSETVRMSEASRRQIMADRILSQKEDAANIATLMDAIENKRQVILHGYSSSHSGEIKDRTVEPFAFAAGKKTVWCYEPETKTNKVFKIDRISNVEILAEGWLFETHHQKGNMDIFNMTGETPVNVKLELTLRARNILIEEYPEAEKYLIPTESDDRWILETTVYQMYGIGRFYIGLAGDIQIIEAPGLLEYVREYIAKHIG